MCTRVMMIGTVACALVSVNWPLYGQTHTVKPVVITYTDSSFNASNMSKPQRTITETLGLRSDGAMSIVRRQIISNAAPGTQPFFSLRILNAQAGRYIVVDQLTRSRTTYSSSIQGEAMFQISTTCSGTPENPLLGFAVVRQENRFPAAGSRVFSTRIWRSPELNCLVLRIEKTVRDPATGNRWVEVEMANSVQLQSPPAWMFTVPADFVERKPSEVLAEAARIQGAHVESSGQAAQDAAYETSKPR